jgi:hypothetical protein
LKAETIESRARVINLHLPVPAARHKWAKAHDQFKKRLPMKDFDNESWMIPCKHGSLIERIGGSWSSAFLLLHGELSVALVQSQGYVFRSCALLRAKASGRPVLPEAETPYLD